MLKKSKQNYRARTTDEIIDDFVDGLDKKSYEKDKEHKRHYYRMRPRRPRFVIPLILSVAVISLACFILYNFGILGKIEDRVTAFFDKSKAVVNSLVVTEGTASATSADNITSETISSSTDSSSQSDGAASGKTAPSKIFAEALKCETDYKEENAKGDIFAAIDSAAKNSLTTVFVGLNNSNGILTDNEEGKNTFSEIVKHGDDKAISVFAQLDLLKLAGIDITDKAAVEKYKAAIISLCEVDGLDGIMVSGLSRNKNGTDFSEYVASGNLIGYKAYSENVVTRVASTISKTVREKNPALYLGVICDSVYATSDYKKDGMSVNADKTVLKDQNADIIKWANEGYFDSVFVNADTTTISKDVPFETVAKWWSDNIPVNCGIGFILSSDKAAAGKGEWSNPDQLTRQLQVLSKMNRFVFCFNSYKAMQNEDSEVVQSVFDFISGGLDNSYILKDLSFTSPTKKTLTTYENSIAITGASDPKFKLTMNGSDVKRTELGYFSLQLDLKVGKNTFEFKHKGSTETFNITYRYVVLKEVTPSVAITLDGGSTIVVKALARSGSSVTATLNGSTIKLSTGIDEAQGSSFCTYSGSFVLPDGYKSNTSIGRVTFKGTHNGVTETSSSGKITVRKSEQASNGSSGGAAVTPSGGSYINVGAGLVAEATKYQIETFNGKTTDDYSQPYNNYFPLGTVDYCSSKTVYDSESGGTYRVLRCGRRVYTQSKGIQNVKTYNKTLPKTNTISVKSCSESGHHTVITFGTDWKAPFLFDILPQKYNPSDINNRGKITSATFNYIDITFCYASAFNGTVDVSGSDVFSKAQIIKNTADYTLRLYLKKTGAFYGWTADYNSAGNLVFKFLNPQKAQSASNVYGGTLKGINIVVDAGHGGSDGGASGSNKNYDEAALSLILADKVKQKLEYIGAKVTMTRTSDVKLEPDTRIQKVRNALPDLAVSVHRNSSVNTKANGYYSYYFNAYTQNPAEKIRLRMKNSSTYNSYNIGWHYFYLSRISTCPVVLTENGFMSNSGDYSNMLNNTKQEQCATAIVQGIVDYFKSVG